MKKAKKMTHLGIRMSRETKIILQQEANRLWQGNLSFMVKRLLESKARQIQKRESNAERN